MNKHNITGLRATLECDVHILSNFSKLISSKGFNSVDDFLQHLLDEDMKKELTDLSPSKISEMSAYLINEILDNDSWEGGETYFNSNRPFTFVNAYKILKECDSEFPYPDWEDISKHGRIALGKAFKQEILENSKKAKSGDLYIKIKDKTMNNSSLYQVYTAD